MYSSDSQLATGYMMGRDSGNGGYGNGMGWGGDWFWGIILIALLFNGGWGGFGGGFGGGAGATTSIDASLQRGFDTQTIIGKLDGINGGLCDGFYAINSGMLTGFHGIENAICANGYNNAQLANGIQASITDSRFAAQQCCCETNRNIDAVRYENSRNTCDIITAGQANTQRIIDALTQDKMDSLRDQLQTANFQLSQQAQNAYLVNQLRPCPIPAYLSCSPYQTYGFPYGGNSGCGCNSGCGL